MSRSRSVETSEIGAIALCGGRISFSSLRASRLFLGLEREIASFVEFVFVPRRELTKSHGSQHLFFKKVDHVLVLAFLVVPLGVTQCSALAVVLDQWIRTHGQEVLCKLEIAARIAEHPRALHREHQRGLAFIVLLID